MKLVFFNETLPREVNVQIYNSFPYRAYPPPVNEEVMSWLEAFVQLGYEVHTLTPSFARPVIEAEFGLNSSGGGAQSFIRSTNWNLLSLF
jgi:hypothetical protein